MFDGIVLKCPYSVSSVIFILHAIVSLEFNIKLLMQVIDWNLLQGSNNMLTFDMLIYMSTEI
jgi:hypothetical protein